MKEHPLYIGGRTPSSSPSATHFQQDGAKFYLLITTTLSFLSGMAFPLKNEATLMTHSVYSMSGMHRLHVYVQEDGIVFFSKIYLAV